MTEERRRDNIELHQAIHELSVHMAAHTEVQKRLVSDVEGHTQELKKVAEKINTARGGVLVFQWLASIGAVGAIVQFVKLLFFSSGAK